MGLVYYYQLTCVYSQASTYQFAVDERSELHIPGSVDRIFRVRLYDPIPSVTRTRFTERFIKRVTIGGSRFGKPRDVRIERLEVPPGLRRCAGT